MFMVPKSASALAYMQEEAQQLSHYLTECKTVPRDSIVMTAVLDTVTVILQRAEIGLLRSKIKDHGILEDFMTAASHADSAITNGMDEEIAHLDSLLNNLYLSARGKRRGGTPPRDECPPLFFKPLPPEPEPKPPLWFTEYAKNAPPFDEDPVEKKEEEAKEEKAAASEKPRVAENPAENPDAPPTIPQAPLAIPAGTALSEFPRLPPDWDFPKCTTKELFRQYWLPDFKTGAPAIHTLKKKDVKHLKRGGRNLNEAKRLVKIIEEEARRKGIWKEEPETEEEVDWIFEQCRDRIEQLIMPLTRKRRFQLAWQTDIRYIREAIKKKKDEDQLAEKQAADGEDAGELEQDNVLEQVEYEKDEDEDMQEDMQEEGYSDGE